MSTINGVFSLFFLLPGYFSPRTGYHRVLKSFVGFLSHTKNKIWGAKISAGVDGGLSGGSSVRRPGSEDPLLATAEINLFLVLVVVLPLLKSQKGFS